MGTRRGVLTCLEPATSHADALASALQQQAAAAASARQIDSIVGGMHSAPSLAELLENSDWWGEGKAEEVESIEEELQLLRNGGPGAVREKRMQESVQAWLLAKRNETLKRVKLRRLADRVGQGGRAEALLEDSLNILYRKTDHSHCSAAACELQELKLMIDNKERELDSAQRRVMALEAALEVERQSAARLTVSRSAPRQHSEDAGALLPGGVSKHAGQGILCEFCMNVLKKKGV